MVAPVEIGMGGVELLVDNGLLKQHQVNDRHAVGAACLAALEQVGRGTWCAVHGSGLDPSDKDWQLLTKPQPRERKDLLVNQTNFAALTKAGHATRFGAGEGNRTLVTCLGSKSSTIELHPRLRSFIAGQRLACNYMDRNCATIIPFFVMGR
jgi:hypothetical protein